MLFWASSRREEEGCYKLRVTNRAFLALETHVFLHAVYYPESPVAGGFMSLVPVAQSSVVSEALGHSGGLHEQDFFDLKTAGIHGEYRLNVTTQRISAFTSLCNLRLWLSPTYHGNQCLVLISQIQNSSP
jgi:hypothetical protein